jgi:hypothetical protein
MEHSHIIVEELAGIKSRLQSLEGHLDGEHEQRHFNKACVEVETLLRLVEERINTRGDF